MSPSDHSKSKKTNAHILRRYVIYTYSFSFNKPEAVARVRPTRSCDLWALVFCVSAMPLIRAHMRKLARNKLSAQLYTRVCMQKFFDASQYNIIQHTLMIAA